MALTKVPSNLDATIATTQSQADNSTNIATTAYVDLAVSNLSDSAPAALNTLNEIAAALGDDANYASTTTAAIAAKLPLAGGTMTGALTSNSLIKTTGDVEIASAQPKLLLDRGDGSYSWNIYNGGGTDFPLSSFNIANNADTAIITALDNGNVGIGETSPDRQLHLTGSGANNARIKLENTSASYYAGLVLTASAKEFHVGVGGASVAAGYANSLYIHDATAGALRATIDTSGNVGIGTATPGSNHAKANNLVVGSGSAGGMAIFNGTGEGWYAFSRANANNTDSYDGGISYDGSRNLKFHTNAGAARMTIKGTGKVGINTTDPKQLLQVKETSTANQVHYPVSIGGSTHVAGYAVGIGLDPEGYGDRNKVAIVVEGRNNGYSRGLMHFLMDKTDDSSSATIADSKMVIHEDGLVGIGTTEPQAKFDVTVGNAKTANAGVWGYLGKTNESSGYQALQCFQIGGNAADERRYEFQTIEQGASNDGIICLQKSGGRVFIGHDSADGNGDKLVIAGSIGISNDAVIGAGSGYGPSNGAGSSGTIKLYDSSNGNMTISTNYSSGDTVFNMQGNTKFLVKGGAAGNEAVQFHTAYGGFRVGAVNSSYHHTMRMSGPSTYYWDNACEASGGFSTYSDERLKENIVAIPSALDKVALMNGVTFTWKDAENRGGGNTGKQFGVIAQNMLEVDAELPSLKTDPLALQEDINNDDIDTDYYTLDYSRITPFLIEAVKELKTKLEAAEARITELEG
jgi:hypothetical protein